MRLRVQHEDGRIETLSLVPPVTGLSGIKMGCLEDSAGVEYWFTEDGHYDGWARKTSGMLPSEEEVIVEQIEGSREIEPSPFLYVRFGELPPDGRSSNYLTEDKESGVSVYEAVRRNSKIQIILPTPTGSTCVGLSGHLRDRPAHEVRGELIGVGSDGEPLLRDVEVMGEIDLGGKEDW